MVTNIRAACDMPTVYTRNFEDHSVTNVEKSGAAMTAAAAAAPTPLLLGLFLLFELLTFFRVVLFVAVKE